MFPNLYILPGLTREADRVVVASSVVVSSRPGVVSVTFTDGERAIGESVYPYVIPCLHRPEWENLETFQGYVGRDVKFETPFRGHDVLSRGASTGYVAFADGTVYERQYVSRSLETLRPLPCPAQAAVAQLRAQINAKHEETDEDPDDAVDEHNDVCAEAP